MGCTALQVPFPNLFTLLIPCALPPFLLFLLSPCSAWMASGSSTPASSAKVLHLGSGVGGLAFALSKHFGRVVGVDGSSTFVRHARIMQHHGQEEFERVREGILTETVLVSVRKPPFNARALVVHTRAHAVEVVGWEVGESTELGPGTHTLLHVSLLAPTPS